MKLFICLTGVPVQLKYNMFYDTYIVIPLSQPLIIVQAVVPIIAPTIEAPKIPTSCYLHTTP